VQLPVLGSTTHLANSEAHLPVAASELCNSDPLLKWLMRLPGGGSWRVTTLAVCVHAVFCLGGGSAVSFHYARLGHEFLSIFDLRELPLALFVYLVAAPAIWTLYEGQPRWILQTFSELSSNGVILRRRQTLSLEAYLRQTICRPLSSPWYFAIALVAGLTGVVMVASTAYPAHYRYFFGEPTIWFLLSRSYFWVLWVPAVLFVPVYMVAWLFIRQVFALRSLHSMYGNFRLMPVPFHPDRCNGVAAVGEYAMKTARAFVFFAGWVFIMTTFPMLFKIPMRLDATTLLPLIVYPIALPVLLLGPVWSTHRAMCHAKSRALEILAVQMRALLSRTDTTVLVETPTERTLAPYAMIQTVSAQYRLLDKEYHTWPFHLPGITRLGLTATVTWLYYAVSVLMSLYSRV